MYPAYCFYSLQHDNLFLCLCVSTQSLISWLQLISLDMGALIAGAKYRGEFEDRLKSVLKEVTDSDSQIILFIDEIHTVVGAGINKRANFTSIISNSKVTI